MAATRRTRAIDIFQDANIGFEAEASTMNSTFNSQSQSSPLEESLILPFPIDQSGSSLFPHDNNLLPLQGQPSPRKQHHKSSSPLRHVFSDRSNISLPPPETLTARIISSPIKKPVTSIYQPIAMQQPSSKPLFATFPTSAAINKENVQPSHRSDNFAEFPGPDYGPKSKGKRTLLDSASIEERLTKKARAQEITQHHIPEPHDMPIIENDGGKPPYSYATLIGMSILRAPHRRLTLAQIYKWISDTFAHYRAAESGWQNSIRHNLSLSKDFIKKDRPKDDPGKGNYWTILPGEEHKFVKERPCRRPASSSGITKAPQSTSELNLSSSLNLPSITETLEARASTKTRPAEPSSDATISASDPALQDDFDDVRGSMPPPRKRGSLSPAAHLGSSPPQMARPRSSRGISPALGHDLSSSANISRSRKRKCNALNDSGYYSSLEGESSAARPQGFSAPHGEAVAPRYKRGRAEEEIARIRSSSHDISPTKGASMKKPRYQYLSSSPTRSIFLAPLTPGMTFQMPAKLPPSVSPNTNLRNHRNKIRALVGSPVKQSDFPEIRYGFSPAFNIVEEDQFHFHESPRIGFNVFSDRVEDRRANGSPVKRRNKKVSNLRPNVGGALAHIAGLADITNTNGNRLHPTAIAPFLRSPIHSRSPSKSPNRLKSPDFQVDFGHSDFFGLDLFANDGEDDVDGLDLMQGFQKIGDKENTKIRDSKSHKAPRTGLGASSATSTF